MQHNIKTRHVLVWSVKKCGFFFKYVVLVSKTVTYSFNKWKFSTTVLADGKTLAQKMKFFINKTETKLVTFYDKMLFFHIWTLQATLKLVSAIFDQIFIFSSSDRLPKTMRNVFCFMLKALFVLDIFKFL